MRPNLRSLRFIDLLIEADLPPAWALAEVPAQDVGWWAARRERSQLQ